MQPIISRFFSQAAITSARLTNNYRRCCRSSLPQLKNVASFGHRLNCALPAYRFATSSSKPFDARNVIRDSAKFELATSNLPNGALIQQKIVALQNKLDNESPFNDSEKAMMTLMTLGDQNLRAKNTEIAGQILSALQGHLELYQNENMAFYQYLLPGVLFRQALVLESTQLPAEEEKAAGILQEIVSIIEEYHEHSETLIEENIHLLAKVHERLGNYFKKLNRVDEAMVAFEKALSVGSQVYAKESTFIVKAQCFLGDLQSRSDKSTIRQASLANLRNAVANVKIRNAQDAQIFSIAATALLRVVLDKKNNSDIKQEEIDQALVLVEGKSKEEKLVTPLSKSVLLTLKAEYQAEEKKLAEAMSTFDEALAFALATFPKEHPFVMKIFMKMKELQKELKKQ